MPSLAFCNRGAKDVNCNGLLNLVCHFHSPTHGSKTATRQMSFGMRPWMACLSRVAIP